MKLSDYLFLSLLPVLASALPAAGSVGNGNADSVSDANGNVQSTDNNEVAANESTNGTENSNQTQADAADDDNGNAVNPNHAPSDQQIANAVLSWMNDTGKVTQFLNTATSFSGDEFTREATIALNAELDELNHKKVLDDALLAGSEAVQGANDVLETQGTFQAVVDVLQAMVDGGPDNAQAQVDEINLNRCVNVLPNIDAYFSAAGSAEVSAVRPTGCLEIESRVTEAASGTGGEASPSVTAAPTQEVEVNETGEAEEANANNVDEQEEEEDEEEEEGDAEEEEEGMDM